MTEYINKLYFRNDLLPKHISISTMSCTCKLGTNIILKNILNCMQLNDHDIITIKYCGVLKSLDEKTLKKKKKTENRFFNQLTTEVRPSEGKKINIKLFKNGSMQMTGCKTISDINSALTRLVARLVQVKAIVENGKIVEKKFIEDEKAINVTDFKIDMINCNYDIQFEINREMVYKMLKDINVECRYEPCKHACVNIKKEYRNDSSSTKKVSIFVFQSGKIIITGAKNHEHINIAYDFIDTFLKEHRSMVEKKDIGKILMCPEISKLLE